VERLALVLAPDSNPEACWTKELWRHDRAHAGLRVGWRVVFGRKADAMNAAKRDQPEAKSHLLVRSGFVGGKTAKKRHGTWTRWGSPSPSGFFY